MGETGAFACSTRRLALAVGAMMVLGLSQPSDAADQRRAESSQGEPGFGGPWTRMPATVGGPVEMRPFPPRHGRSRCIPMAGMAGAQLFGDSALEITMRDSRRFRLFFDRECPALSFYQGFYYRRQKAGQLCAGRDAIGARSGGECPIASIIELRKPGNKTRRRR